ncbi:family 16 glycosylhydrolase [Hyphomonas sp.]|uniref:family 16 glycosylhydrolase n=1 Tax=Hyphomonas sp. TaxID=87 RepID=UPI0025BFED46|nr:family 16 glycosylhydrolase [Hyphomonas sp.]
MAEHKPSPAAQWRCADTGVDRLVLGSWAAFLALALWLLQPPAPARSPLSETEAAAVLPEPVAAANEPDFYPWVRPVERDMAPVVTQPWSPKRKPRTGGFLTRLTFPSEDPVFTASDHGNANSYYGGDWLPANVDARNGGAFLEVKRESHGGLPYTAAEMQSGQTYHYGRYEVIMQPAPGSGLVTAFFTYTGPWFGDPHDEIDIEFLGTDTTKIHFNYFRKGKTNQPAVFDLPFDAAAAPRLYAFEWRPDGITWFVDGVPYYATRPGDPGVPQTAGKVMFSTWTGKSSIQGWHGKPLFRDGAGAQFNCVSFTPLGHETPSCADSYVPASGGSLKSVQAR